MSHPVKQLGEASRKMRPHDNAKRGWYHPRYTPCKIRSRRGADDRYKNHRG
jgi:hypothetical protein